MIKGLISSKNDSCQFSFFLRDRKNNEQTLKLGKRKYGEEEQKYKEMRKEESQKRVRQKEAGERKQMI